MTTKNLIGLAVAAAVLGGAAYLCGSGRRIGTASVNGKPVVGAFDAADVAKIEIGGEKKLTLAATEQGWVIETMLGYPADVAKIRENVLKLSELKVGQVAPGVAIDQPIPVELKDAKGAVLASVTLGGQHMAKPRGEMAMFGGSYPDGRYVRFGERTVLVKDALDAFDGDPMKWCDAKLSDKPYLRFTSVVDPAQEATCGFATGTVCKVSYNGDTNAVAMVGGTAPSGDRYFRIDGEKSWIFTIPSYSADSLTKPKEEPKPAAEPASAPAEDPAPAAEPQDAPKAEPASEAEPAAKD